MKITLLSVLIFLLFFSACATQKGSQSGPDSWIVLSGSFSAKDSPQVARELSLEITSHPWLENFKSTRKRSPVMMIGPITNESYQPIDTGLFARQLMHEILNAGQMSFVEEIPVPLKTRGEPTLELARELKADFFLTAAVRTASGSVKGKQVRYIQLDMRLLEVATGQPVWTTLRPIKQTSTQS